MIDFLIISTRMTKRGVEIYPKFRTYPKSSDLMIRGGDFYAIWIEELGLWSTDEQDVLRIIDRELDKFAKENQSKFDAPVKVLHMWDSESGMIDSWHRYCQKQLRDSFHMLDEQLIFSNTETSKKDYASKRLSYPLEQGSISAYDRLMSVIYSEEERHKIEWAIGSIVCGDSKKLQKFMVLYGAAGTGKSTILNIIQKLFEGYYSVFDAKALGSASNSFALEAFKSNPLVAIQHDGDLSRIEDNTRLNSLVSHELMTVNEKFKATYANSFKCFLFMGTNKPVKITDGKSGLIRRLIDVSPSGKKLNPKEYKTIMKQIDFELGAIAWHCREVYLADPGAYDDYIPMAMMGASNDFYNYIMDSYHVFKNEDGTTLKAAWEMYKTYCDDAKVPYTMSQRSFKEELKNYFWEYNDRFSMDDGSRVRSYYSGFRTDKFELPKKEERPKEEQSASLICLDSTESILDQLRADCPAQYANAEGTPKKKWDSVTTTLADIDTSKLHYVRLPEQHIYIDFDLVDKNGNKNLELNLREASKFPPTYAEVSKSGNGIHLHYIYSGDVSRLSRIYDERIEIKQCSGLTALRRKLTKCNNLPIATISSGLPLKGEDKLVNPEVVQTEKGIRTTIKRCLNKEIHPSTKSNVDFIFKILEDAYDSDLVYDVSDMYNAVFAFAANSTNQSDYCLKLVDKMHFQSDEPSVPIADPYGGLIFYDVEVFPNLLLVNWKHEGEDHPVMRMINPTSSQVEELLRFKLVGFNNRGYDNHILYARLMGYTNEQIYDLSRRIINEKDRSALFREAYNLSYTDVYDFSAKKQSLKKWEIELGIHHQELGLPWDQPVPEERWAEVAEYCDNDVIATEAVFNHLKGDWSARQILAKLANGSVNDTTNSLSAKFIFGSNRNPQDQFNYRDMGDMSTARDYPSDYPDLDCDESYTVFDDKLRPIFPGYKYDYGKSIYRGEEVGEGGYVYAEPGIYYNIALLDIASMHPSSIIAENLFGPIYTKRFKDIRDARVAIKHGDFVDARKMLDGALNEYIAELESGSSWFTKEDLAQALKIVINSIYGLTAAGFENPFRDSRNKDNIVAKRGALFMVNLKHEVQRRGFTVVHIKTDSIKIAEATPEIIKFVMDYGELYGYTFEHEDTYDRICLVNDAVYIAKYKEPHIDKKTGEVVEWTATGKQFQVPYVFKSLFSKKPIEFKDMCETMSVTTSLHLDLNEGYPDTSLYDDILALRQSVKKLTKREQALLDEYANASDDDIRKLADEGHNRHFVGRVGSFCPIKPGCGGGVLVREGTDNDGNIKYSSATGAKGYRWLESEMVKTLEKQNDIDRTYYNALVDGAVDTISKYGDFELFVSECENAEVPF